MYQKIALLLTLLPFFAFQCQVEPDCTFTLDNRWSFGHLDNSGAAPVPASGAVQRQAYGFRLTAPVIRTGADNCTTFSNYTDVFSTLSIRTRRPWHGYPAGTEINDLFRFRTPEQEYPVAAYLQAAPYVLTEYLQKPLAGDSLRLDFVLLDPPASADSLHLEIALQMGDSIQVLLQPNPVFLK